MMIMERDLGLEGILINSPLPIVLYCSSFARSRQYGGGKIEYPSFPGSQISQIGTISSGLGPPINEPFYRIYGSEYSWILEMDSRNVR